MPACRLKEQATGNSQGYAWIANNQQTMLDILRTRTRLARCAMVRVSTTSSLTHPGEMQVLQGCQFLSNRACAGKGIANHGSSLLCIVI